MRNNKDYVWAILLIFLGSVLLLNTTGILDWNVWLYIASYWPIFLILGGLKLILGRSLVSTILLSILALVAFSWIGICSYNNEVENPLPFFERMGKFCISKQIETSENLTEKEFTVDTDGYEGVQELDYDINLGISEFSITDGSEEYLFLNAKYPTQFQEPSIGSKVINEKLYITVKEVGSSTFSPVNFKTPTYTLVFGSELPSNIKIDNGVGRGSVNFESQLINKLRIDTGTGDMNVKLSFDSIPSEELELNVGTGKMTLTLPFDVGYEIDYSLGIGSINLGDRSISGFDKDEDEAQSGNYNTANKTLKIKADVGVGQLVIN